MKRYILFALVVLLLAGLACEAPVPTETPTAPPATRTPTATENPAETPTATQEPSPTPSSTPPTPTPIVPAEIPEDAPELFLYPGAEGVFHDCSSGNCAPFWVDYFCNDGPLDEEGFQYAPQKCVVPLVCEPGQTTGCNQPAYMATFESKEAAVWVDDYRVASGERAIQQFCAGRNCWGGVYQVVDTSNAAYCLATGKAQGWFAADWRSNAAGNPEYRSDTSTVDDRRNGHAQIVVYLDGGPPYFFDGAGNQLPLRRDVDDPNMVVSVDYGYEAGLYDIVEDDELGGFAQMVLFFIPTGPQTTVSYEWYNLWPGQYNEVYFDDLSVRCAPLAGEATVDIAAQSLDAGAEAPRENIMEVNITGLLLTLGAIVLLLLGHERIIEILQWVLSNVFKIDVSGADLAVITGAIITGLTGLAAVFGWSEQLQEILDALTPNFTGVVEWVYTLFVLLGGFGLFEAGTGLAHSGMQKANKTGSARGN